MIDESVGVGPLSARPSAKHVADDTDRRSAIALPDLGELDDAVVKDIVDDLDTRLLREVDVGIAIAVVRAQITNKAEVLRPVGSLPSSAHLSWRGMPSAKIEFEIVISSFWP